jgi:hypothetical protein
MNNKRRDILIFLVAAFFGLLIWLTISRVTGQAEAWDSPLFFSIGVPALIGVATVAGAIRPGRSFLWGIATIAFQPIALFSVGKPDALAGVGLFFFLIFALLCAIGAFVGGLLRRGISQTFRRSASLCAAEQMLEQKEPGLMRASSQCPEPSAQLGVRKENNMPRIAIELICYIIWLVIHYSFTKYRISEHYFHQTYYTIVFLLIYLSGILVFIDSVLLKIYKNTSTDFIKSPCLWAIGTNLFIIIVLPIYLVSRRELALNEESLIKTKYFNYFLWFTFISSVLVLLIRLFVRMEWLGLKWLT